MGASLKFREAEACAPTDPYPIAGFPRFGSFTLQGVFNCRDLGGMPADGGRRIKKRRLIRSAEIGDATAEDMQQLVRMHDLGCVVDLRADYEVESAPDPLPLMHGIEYMRLPVLSDDAIGFTGLKNFKRDVRMLARFVKGPYELVQELYPKCLLGQDGIKAYATLLNDLLGVRQGATLWHCTQGKDRTGIAAMLVEYALGVPMEYIRDDYLATNIFIKPWVDKMSDALRGTVVFGGLGVDIEAYSFANECYFETAIGAIRESFGSIDNYLARALDFGPDKQRALRSLYLE